MTDTGLDVTARAHAWLHPVLTSGATVLDATCGNGHDTLFLARAVAPGGRVHAVDRQALAIDRSRHRLAEANPAARIDWHHCNHADIATVLGNTRLDAAMFNLGWLPRSDSAVVTQPRSTLAALDTVVERLRPEARITIVCYRGHANGAEEAQAVTDWLATAPVRRRAKEPEQVGDTGPLLYVLESPG